jgi:restriction endonuclease S subunit
MIVDKIENLFDFIGESNILESDVYSSLGEYPVFSGSTTNEGIVGYYSKYHQDKDCITFVTYGNAGKMFVRSGKFTIGRNCMGIIPKVEYVSLINLEWFKNKFQNTFYQTRNGNSSAGQKSLNKGLLSPVVIEIPDLETQKTELAKFNKVNSSLDSIKNLLELLDKLENKHVLIESKKEMTNVSVEKVFESVSGNSGLTEEFIYHISEFDGERYEVLSSSIMDHTKMGQVPFCKLPDNKPLKVFKNSYGILVARKGNAGSLTFLKKGNYALNDNVYALF